MIDGHPVRPAQARRCKHRLIRVTSARINIPADQVPQPELKVGEITRKSRSGSDLSIRDLTQQSGLNASKDFCASCHGDNPSYPPIASSTSLLP